MTAVNAVRLRIAAHTMAAAAFAAGAGSPQMDEYRSAVAKAAAAEAADRRKRCGDGGGERPAKPETAGAWRPSGATALAAAILAGMRDGMTAYGAGEGAGADRSEIRRAIAVLKGRGAIRQVYSGGNARWVLV